MRIISPGSSFTCQKRSETKFRSEATPGVMPASGARGTPASSGASRSSSMAHVDPWGTGNGSGSAKR